MVRRNPEKGFRATQDPEAGLLPVPEDNTGMSLHDRIGAFPVIETERLRLREICPEKDAKANFEMLSNPETMKYLPWKPPASEEESLKGLENMRAMFYDERYVLPWVIALKEDDPFIGRIRYYSWFGHGFRIGEVGYELSSDHWGKGFTTEALKAVVDYGFKELGLVRVQLTTRLENTASVRVALKAGFMEEGVLRCFEFDQAREKWQDVRMLSIIRATEEGRRD